MCRILATYPRDEEKRNFKVTGGTRGRNLNLPRPLLTVGQTPKSPNRTGDPCPDPSKAPRGEEVSPFQTSWWWRTHQTPSPRGASDHARPPEAHPGHAPLAPWQQQLQGRAARGLHVLQQTLRALQGAGSLLAASPPRRAATQESAGRPHHVRRGAPKAGSVTAGGAPLQRLSLELSTQCSSTLPVMPNY